MSCEADARAGVWTSSEATWPVRAKISWLSCGSRLRAQGTKWAAEGGAPHCGRLKSAPLGFTHCV